MTAYWLSGIAGLLMGGAVAGGVQQLRVQAAQTALVKVEKQSADTARDLAEKTAGAYKKVSDERDALAKKLAQADADSQTALAAKTRENDGLRDTVRIGARSLRIVGARCDAGTGAVPEAAGSGGVVNAEPELDAALRERVFDLRQAVIEADAQIKYLQDYVRSVSATGEK